MEKQLMNIDTHLIVYFQIIVYLSVSNYPVS